MRTKLAAGLVTAIAAASFAAPGLAQAQVNPNGPQIHIDTCSVKQMKGYTSATCPLYAINMDNQTVNVTVKSNMKNFEPKGFTSYLAAQTGTIGVPGNDKVYSVFPLKFAFKGKTPAQVRKSLRVTISNPTNGGSIVNAVATVPS
jgi:hypothetical protein